MEDKLKQQIEEWQTKWRRLQALIDDKIKAGDYHGAFRMQTIAITLKVCIRDASDILEPQE